MPPVEDYAKIRSVPREEHLAYHVDMSIQGTERGCPYVHIAHGWHIHPAMIHTSMVHAAVGHSELCTDRNQEILTGLAQKGCSNDVVAEGVIDETRVINKSKRKKVTFKWIAIRSECRRRA